MYLIISDEKFQVIICLFGLTLKRIQCLKSKCKKLCIWFWWVNITSYTFFVSLNFWKWYHQETCISMQLMGHIDSESKNYAKFEQKMKLSLTYICFNRNTQFHAYSDPRSTQSDFVNVHEKWYNFQTTFKLNFVNFNFSYFVFCLVT